MRTLGFGVGPWSWPGNSGGSLAAAAGVLLGVLLLDLLGYAVHRGLHAASWLWPLHAAHHSDTEFDVTVAFRFHPLEVLFSSALRTLVAAALGVPMAALLAYAVLNALHNAFAHANASLPPALERWVASVLVTPDLHRVHHALDTDMANANFGVVFSLWDRMFGSLRFPLPGEPRSFGVPALRGHAPLGLAALLALPLRRQTTPEPDRDPLSP